MISQPMLFKNAWMACPPVSSFSPQMKLQTVFFSGFYSIKTKCLFAFGRRGSMCKIIRGKKGTRFMKWLEKKVGGTGVFLALPEL